MSIDLKKLQEKFDKFFAEENHETFEKWLCEKISSDKNDELSVATMPNSSNDAGHKAPLFPNPLPDKWKEELMESLPPARNKMGADITAAYIIWIENNVVNPLLKEIEQLKTIPNNLQEILDKEVYVPVSVEDELPEHDGAYSLEDYQDNEILTARFYNGRFWYKADYPISDRNKKFYRWLKKQKLIDLPEIGLLVQRIKDLERELEASRSNSNHADVATLPCTSSNANQQRYIDAERGSAEWAIQDIDMVLDNADFGDKTKLKEINSIIRKYNQNGS